MSIAYVGGAVVGAVGSSLLAPSPDNSAGNAAAAASASQAAISQDQWNYYKTNYQPAEQQLIDQARAAGSPEEIAAAQGRASADVTKGFDIANKSAANRMQAYGINPNSGATESAITSSGLAEGAANAGARTTAYNQQKALGYSKLLDVVGIGRNIPAQSAASAGGAAYSAGIAQNSLNSQFLQNQTNQRNTGYLAQGLMGAARSYYGSSGGNPSYGAGVTNTNNANNAMAGNTTGNTLNPDGVKDGGLLTKDGVSRYAEGGNVTEENDNILDMQKGEDGKYSADGLEPTLLKKGFHPNMAKMASKGVITPHMRRHPALQRKGYASGGGVGAQGLEVNSTGVLPPSQSNQTLDGPGSETSDSIPAQVDGNKPAALSKGEFVMSAEVPKLSGEEILQAINKAGLEKRDQAGNGQENDQMNSADVNQNAGANAYADGGNVDWKAQYKKITGYDADAAGIKDPESADRNIRQMQQMRQAQPVNFPVNSDSQDVIGARNEAIYPVKRGYANGGEVKPSDAPIGSGLAKKAADTISAKQQYDRESIEAQTEGRDMPSFDEWQSSRQGYARGGKVCSIGLGR